MMSLWFKTEMFKHPKIKALCRPAGPGAEAIGLYITLLGWCADTGDMVLPDDLGDCGAKDASAQAWVALAAQGLIRPYGRKIAVTAQDDLYRIGDEAPEDEDES